MLKLLVWVVILNLTVFHTPVAADIYTWVDENGITHFSDQPPKNSSSTDVQVMPSHAPQTAVKAKDGHASGDGAGENPKVRETRSSSSRSEHRVELFTTSWCGYCKMAKEFFRRRGIAFEEYDIEKDPRAAARKRQLDGSRGVPFAVINGVKVSGYSETAYKQALYGR